MAITYEKIASSTLSSNAAAVTFSSIPSTYTDIQLVINGGATTNTDGYLYFNNDRSNIYSNTNLYANGTTVTTNRDFANTAIYLNKISLVTTTLGVSNILVSIFNYSNATTYKTILSRANNAAVGTTSAAGVWQSTATINRIDITPFGYNWITGSTFTLYGIKAA